MGSFDPLWISLITNFCFYIIDLIICSSNSIKPPTECKWWCFTVEHGVFLFLFFFSQSKERGWKVGQEANYVLRLKYCQWCDHYIKIGYVSFFRLNMEKILKLDYKAAKFWNGKLAKHQIITLIIIENFQKKKKRKGKEEERGKIHEWTIKPKIKWRCPSCLAVWAHLDLLSMQLKNRFNFLYLIYY